jgi:hypothetical protein
MPELYRQTERLPDVFRPGGDSIMTAPDNRPTNLREIFEAVYANAAENNGNEDYRNAVRMDFDEAIAAVLALLPEKRYYLIHGEQVAPVGTQYYARNETIDQTRRNLIGEQNGDSESLSDAQATLSQVDNLRPESAPEEGKQ